MASIQKDPKTGKWYCRVSYKDQNGVRRQKMKKGFSTKKEASIAATRLEKAVYDRVDIAARDVVFADYFERWVRSYKSGKYGTSTELKYLREVDYVRKYFGAKKLSDLTRSDLQSYINQRGKNKSKDTIEKAYNKIKNCLKMALADGLIIIDPTYQIELVYNKSKRPKLKYFNKQEAQKLQAALSQEVDYKNAMLLIALRAGLRIGEIYGLKWEDIDKDQLSVKRGYDYNYTKSFTMGKTYSSLRTIMIDDMLQRYLNRYKVLVQRQGPYLFLDQKRQPLISHAGLTKYLRTVCQQVDIPALTPHCLRHTHCSLLLAEGVDIHYISKRLGHKNVMETLKTYAHMIDELKQLQDQRVMDILNNFA